MIGSIYGCQFDILPPFAVGTESLCGQINNSFRPEQLDWNISADLGEVPQGADAVFDILVSADSGATWTSALPPGGKLVVAAAGLNYGSLAAFALEQIGAGSWVKAICLQAGSLAAGKGLQANLYGGPVRSSALLWDDAPGLFDDMPGLFDTPGEV